MTQVPAIIVTLGALLFLMPLIGGGFTVKEVSMPAISSRLRIALFPVSLAMMGPGIWLSFGPPFRLAARQRVRRLPQRRSKPRTEA